MASKIAELFVLIGADVDGFMKGIGGVRGALAETGKLMAGLGVGGFLTSALGDAREAATGLRQLDAVLASTSDVITKVRVDTGGYSDVLVKTTEKIKDATGAHTKKVEVMKKVTIANSELVVMEKATRESILATSDALMKQTGIDDDAITATQSLLLTFTKIGKEVMPDATAATLDMAAALNLSSKEAAIQIGKALQSAQGVTALTRAGVTFTQAEQNKLKALFATGRVMEAQKMILAELNNEFGGSAAAQADGVTRMQTAWGNFAEGIGGVLLPVVDTVARILADVLNQAEPLIPVIAGATVVFAGLAATTGPIGAILAAILGPIGAIGVAVVGLGLAWESNFGGIRDIAAGAWNSIKPGLDELKTNLDNFLQTLMGTQPKSKQLNMRELLTANLPEGDQNILKALKFSLELTPEQRAGLTKDGKKIYDEVLSIAIPDTIPKAPPGLGERLGTAIQEALPGLKKGFEDLLTGAKTWLETDGKKMIEDALATAIKFADNVAIWVQDNAPKIKDGVMAWFHAGVNWLNDEAPGEFRGAIGTMLGLADDIIQFVKAHAPDLLAGVSQWATDALNWLASDPGGMGLLKTGLASLFQLGADITGFVKEHAPDLGKGIGDWVRGALHWITNDAPQLVSKAIASLFSGGVKPDTKGMQGGDIAADLIKPTVFETLAQTAMDAMNNIFSTGIGIVTGLFEGLFGLDKGELKKKFDAFFGDEGPLKKAFNGAKTFLEDKFIPVFTTIGNAIAGAFGGVFDLIITPFKNALKWLGEQLVKIAPGLGDWASQVLGVGNALIGFGGGGNQGGGGGGGGGVGVHARGGKVSAGAATVVGEYGPEIFTPSSDGFISTANETRGMSMPVAGGNYGGGGGNSTVYVTQNVSGMTDGRELVEMVLIELKRRNGNGIVIEGMGG